MLHSFLRVNREVIIDRCRSIAALRAPPLSTHAELQDGIPVFLDQLISTLQAEQSSEFTASQKVPGLRDVTPGSFEIGASASRHGGKLSDLGFTVEQVVRDYGDLCQAITLLASEADASIQIDEFQTLNRCLDDGIAEAVTEFSYQRELGRGEELQTLNQRLGFVAHELRNLVSTATMAFSLIKSGRVALGGATGAVMDRSLTALRTLVDRSLADTPLAGGMPAQYALVSVADLIAEVKAAALLETPSRECNFSVSDIDGQLAVDADRGLLVAAIANLLQNAFKFTLPHKRVMLSAYAQGDRIRIDIQEQYGRLQPGAHDHMFQPFTQSGAGSSGGTLGLSIPRRSIEAMNGALSVRDRPGAGRGFTIDLPRRSLA